MLRGGSIRAAVAGGALGAMLAVAVGSTAAAVIYGPVGTTHVIVDYHLRSKFYAVGSDDLAISSGLVRTVSGASRPTGYMGAQARVYYASGTLCRGSTWIYSNYATDVWEQLLPHPCTGSIHSRGNLKMWDGDGYTTHAAPSTSNYVR